MKNEWLTIQNFAKFEGVSKRTIEKRIKQGKYPQEKLKQVKGRG
jgi:transcriptional antiterminator